MLYTLHIYSHYFNILSTYSPVSGSNFGVLCVTKCTSRGALRSCTILCFIVSIYIFTRFPHINCLFTLILCVTSSCYSSLFQLHQPLIHNHKVSFVFFHVNEITMPVMFWALNRTESMFQHITQESYPSTGTAFSWHLLEKHLSSKGPRDISPASCSVYTA